MRISDWSSDVCSSDLCSPDEPFIKEAISRERADLPLGKIEYADLRQGRGHLQIALLGEQPHHMVTPAVGPRLIADAAGFIDVARPAPPRRVGTGRHFQRPADVALRSEARPTGKEWFRTVMFRWAQ